MIDRHKEKKVVKNNIFFSYAGLSLKSWRTCLPEVLDSINYDKTRYKYEAHLLKAYFTQPTTVFPQSWSSFYKYDLKQPVSIDLPPLARRQFGFKWSLNMGTT